MVIVDAFTHYVALNPVPHCNAYYAYTTLSQHLIAKIEWSTDVKLFPLSYNSQKTTTFEVSAFEMVFNQKPRKPIMFTAN